MTMAVNVSPSVPTESSTAAPAGGFSGWFKNIGDWLKSLSPSGATQYDTDWVTTGLTITAATNWTVSSYRCRRVGRQVMALVSVAYSGSTLTVAANGDLSDTTIFTLPSGWRPLAGSWSIDAARAGLSQWFGVVSGAGDVSITHGIPALTIASGNVLTIRLNFFAD
jgi:hypothetical protein